MTIAASVDAMSEYSGGKTRVYGSNTPTPNGAFAPTGDGEDFFIVNRCNRCTTCRPRRPMRAATR